MSVNIIMGPTFLICPKFSGLSMQQFYMPGIAMCKNQELWWHFEVMIQLRAPNAYTILLSRIIKYPTARLLIKLIAIYTGSRYSNRAVRRILI